MRQHDTGPGAWITRGEVGPGSPRQLEPTLTWNVEAEPSPTLLDYAAAIWRRKFMVMGAAVCGALCGVLVGLPQTPVYKATTTLEIQEPNSEFLNIKDLEPTTRSTQGNSYLETQIRILQGAALRRKLVETLKKPQVNQPGLDMLSQTLMKYNLPPLRQSAGSADAVLMANAMLSMRQLGTSQVLQIQTESTDPHVAADFVNGLVREYIDYILESRSDTSLQTSTWLNEQIDELRKRMADSEEQLQRYLRESSLIATADTNLGEERLRRVQSELAQAQAERVQRESRYAVAQETTAESIPDVLDDPNLRSYQVQLTALQSRLLELGVVYGEEHYKIRQVEEQIRALETRLAQEQEKLQQRIRNDYATAKRREEMLGGMYASQVQELVEQKPLLIHYNLLKREVEGNRQLYEVMLQKVKTLKIAGGLRATNVRVLDPAQPGSKPDKPNVQRNVLTGLMTATFLGIMLALLRDSAHRKVMSTPGEAMQKWNVPELGVMLTVTPTKRLALPAATEPKNGGDAHWYQHSAVELVSWQQKSSIHAESVRSVVASILARRMDESLFVVTSPCAKEGKTSVTSNLAAALADINKRVLVIDGDLHNPNMHKVFDVPNSWGLSDLAAASRDVESYPIEELVRPTQLESLHVLPSGPGTANGNRLLYSSRLARLLQRFRKEFDVVLIDTPPMMEIADARVLAKHSDGVILVFRSGSTTLSVARSALERLSQDGTPVVGTILNDWKPVGRTPYPYATT